MVSSPKSFIEKLKQGVMNQEMHIREYRHLGAKGSTHETGVIHIIYINFVCGYKYIYQNHKIIQGK